jgi:hypothetical protein
MTPQKTQRPFLVFLLMICAFCISFSAQAATRIYKTVDEQGNVVFTDVPPKEGEESQQVAVETPNTFEPAAVAPQGREPWNVDDAGNDTAEPATFSYTSVAIVSPTNDEAVRENAGNVTFDVSLEPELRTGDKVRLLLDGMPEQEGPQTSFMLTNVDRGTHSATVEVVDDAGKVLTVSDPVTFHLLRVAAAPRPVQPLPRNQSN